MRLGVVVLILLAVVMGATFGALNADRILLDFWLIDFSVPKGAALLAALLLGWVLGGLLVWGLRVRALRRELRALRRSLAQQGASRVRPDPGSDGLA
ncbi:MAG: lipopolysaccharide assembly protein LapA domain-containing protein [Dokdonella sp.]|jgi:lipopolysaccharide assembly protein A|uniref:lipopolysaccharide assembly protein LapA domain-containing protein n=1 Tax=Dokdonella sp. TaxID=2291710 RepID=UPI001B692828|nr:lipopolysaccharide assembly protein LapA domain-containing protein [Dokdonella sp.]MCC6439459.1 DUF1049 domain-containing protein [Rhodanobacteraceae bacterium]MBK8122025.1 DUF1049 domain-containing protein [Dokdonella sp.]MBP6326537.1 DUF1049 domain-containing protein [Dokdonella sp.]MBP6328514.1 DUF1049 domain-containing protein [Dokdonella sp.]HNV07052.1 lipopolysaccharide assembly protein LapA domain-containing protein [Dokdonella sp.]